MNELGFNYLITHSNHFRLLSAVVGYYGFIDNRSLKKIILISPCLLSFAFVLGPKGDGACYAMLNSTKEKATTSRPCLIDNEICL